MKQEILTVIENRCIAKNTWRMDLRRKADGEDSVGGLLPGQSVERKTEGEIENSAADILPGQFIDLRLEGLFLRRPISVCDAEKDRLTIIYKVVGQGTEWLSGLREGAELDALTGLGNGYDLSKAGESPLLLGGGVGVPPLYFLAKRLRESGKRATAVLGFNTAEEAFLAEDFRALGCETVVTTADGSLGRKGFVTDALPEEYSYFYTCGPQPMLRAVYNRTATDGQFSLEERMGCGFGACMGCSCKTKTGWKRICREGPVLEKEEIQWED